MRLSVILILAVVIAADAWMLRQTFKSAQDWPTRVKWTAIVVLLPLLGWALWARFAPRVILQEPEQQITRK